MIIIESVKQLHDSIRFHKHENKRIGKLDINYNKALTDTFYLHQGHLDCIKKLRESGCDYIMVECINSLNCFKSVNEQHKNTEITTRGYLDYDENVMDDTQLINYCKLLDIDYLIINSDDYNIDIPDEIIKNVDSIIEKEKYKKELNYEKRSIQLLRVNLIVRTFRSLSIPDGVTYIKSYKDGLWIFLLKHYLEKYLNNKLLIIEPTLRSDFKYPLSSSDKLVWDNDSKLFFNYLYNINFKENINTIIKKIQICSDNLNIDININKFSENKYFNGTYLNVNFSKNNNNFGTNILIGD